MVADLLTLQTTVKEFISGCKVHSFFQKHLYDHIPYVHIVDTRFNEFLEATQQLLNQEKCIAFKNKLREIWNNNQEVENKIKIKQTVDACYRIFDEINHSALVIENTQAEFSYETRKMILKKLKQQLSRTCHRFDVPKCVIEKTDNKAGNTFQYQYQFDWAEGANFYEHQKIKSQKWNNEKWDNFYASLLTSIVALSAALGTTAYFFSAFSSFFSLPLVIIFIGCPGFMMNYGIYRESTYELITDIRYKRLFSIYKRSDPSTKVPLTVCITGDVFAFCTSIAMIIINYKATLAVLLLLTASSPHVTLPLILITAFISICAYFTFYGVMRKNIIGTFKAYYHPIKNALSNFGASFIALFEQINSKMLAWAIVLFIPLIIVSLIVSITNAGATFQAACETLKINPSQLSVGLGLLCVLMGILILSRLIFNTKNIIGIGCQIKTSCEARGIHVSFKKSVIIFFIVCGAVLNGCGSTGISGSPGGVDFLDSATFHLFTPEALTPVAMVSAGIASASISSNFNIQRQNSLFDNVKVKEDSHDKAINNSLLRTCTK